MAFSVSRGANNIRVVLSGDVTVSEALELHRALSDVAASETPVFVDEADVISADLSAVQLVLAFARARTRAGLGCQLGEGEILKRLEEVGLDGQLAL